MRLPLATLLFLLAAGRLGAALVRREAASEGSEPVASADFLSRHLQSLSELVARELPPQLRPEELRSQAELYLERANKQLEPLARELHNNVLGLFSSLLRLGRPEGQGDSPATPETP
ncbi:apolipoprotein A-II-like [Anomalospiza imberbis]|uniref:apolipoprotein A-II-like n=1 Tax=Anomalospiza imberbis TaxID=187417 RepID=UPI00358DFEC1